MKVFASFGDGIVRIVDRYLPDPFVFALLMTLLTFALALVFTDAGVFSILVSWGDGLSMLLSFIAQIALLVLFAYALSRLEPIPSLLEKIAGVPSKPWTAYTSATFFAGFVSLINWPLGLILGSLYARAVGIAAKKKGLRLHYPLLGAAAFGGFVVWHMGYSASAPLFVATEGNAMQEQLGGLIPVRETIFATWNIIIALITLMMVAATACLMHPKDPAKIVECDQQAYQPGADSDLDQGSGSGPADRLERSRWPIFVVGLMVLAYVVHWFVTKGLVLDLNIVNWTFLAIGLLLARSGLQFAEAFYSGARAAAPTMLQYPLYGGIMGMMLGSGIIAAIAPAFTRIATENTLPVIAFLFGGLVNFFIPSGGAQWAVQGPAFIEAANELGTDMSLIVMGVAYGDQWTNIIHPFTAIIVVILTGIKARKIISYTVLMWLVSALPLGLGLYLAATLG